MQNWFMLEFKRGKYEGKQLVISPGTQLVFGRHSNADVVLVDNQISRRHARVWWGEGATWIEDLGSRNGTLLNGAELRAPARLSEGSIISLGESKILVSEVDAASAQTFIARPHLEDGVSTSYASTATRSFELGRLSLEEIITQLSMINATGSLTHDETQLTIYLRRGEVAADRVTYARAASWTSGHLVWGSRGLVEDLEFVSAQSFMTRTRAAAGAGTSTAVMIPFAGAGDDHGVTKPWALWEVRATSSREEAEALNAAHRLTRTVHATTFGQSAVRHAWHRWTGGSPWPLRHGGFGYTPREDFPTSLEVFKGPSAQLAMLLASLHYQLRLEKPDGGWVFDAIVATGRFDERGALRDVRGVERKARAFDALGGDLKKLLIVPDATLDHVPHHIPRVDLHEDLTQHRMGVLGVFPEQVGALMKALRLLF